MSSEELAVSPGVKPKGLDFWGVFGVPLGGGVLGGSRGGGDSLWEDKAFSEPSRFLSLAAAANWLAMAGRPPKGAERTVGPLLLIASEGAVSPARDGGPGNLGSSGGSGEPDETDGMPRMGRAEAAAAAAAAGLGAVVMPAFGNLKLVKTACGEDVKSVGRPPLLAIPGSYKWKKRGT